MTGSKRVFAGFLVGLGWLGLTVVANGGEGGGHEVEPQQIVGVGDLFEGFDPDSEAEANLSGATCSSPTTCIVVSDELVAVQQLNLNLGDGAYVAGASFAGLFREHCANPADEESCAEWDLEAVARSGDRIFVAGSMGVKRKSAKRQKSRWVLAAFQVTPASQPRPDSLQVQDEPEHLKRLFSDGRTDLGRFVDKPLQCGGSNVEGLAFLDGSLFFGLRSPSQRDDGRAYVIEARADQVMDPERNRLDPTIHALAFRGADGKPIAAIGIRAIDRLGDRLIIATADAGVGPIKAKKKKSIERMEKNCAALSGGRQTNTQGKKRMVGRLWLWSPGTGDPQPLAVLDGPYRREKLEGVAVIAARENEADLLLVFDKPGEDLSGLAVLRGLPVPAR